MENLREFMESLSEYARSYGVTPGRVKEAELALEEALVNIFHYAYPAEPGDVEVNCREDDDHLIIELIDTGIPFDMTSQPDPDLSSDIESRKVGGLGLFLIKKMVDQVRYNRQGNRNILNLIIKKG